MDMRYLIKILYLLKDLLNKACSYHNSIRFALHSELRKRESHQSH